MEEVMVFLLGSLQLFYPLLIASVIVFVYGLIKRSWISMTVSAVLLYPDAWYFSGYPPFPWAKFIPIIPILIAVVFFIRKRKGIND